MRISSFAELLTRGQFPIVLISLLFAYLALGCSKNEQTGIQVATTWPEFERFEALLLETAELSDAGKSVEVLRRRGELVEAGWAVNLQTLPTEANDCETLRLLLGDLVSKVNRLAVPAIDPSIMREVITGLKPIVTEIGRTSHARES